jgi:dTDP-4-amino-4,6-dideoxygalactose transaminase
MIPVVKPTLSCLTEVEKLLQECWNTGILTHNGPMVQALEKELKIKLKLTNMSAVVNGTLAIQLAIRALNLKGEIILPSFTWIASVAAVEWENCTPVFCDINPRTLNLDPDCFRNLINKKTVAVLPVHVFGQPCEIEEIENIASDHKLKVIYDAAHSVGSKYKGESVLNFGNVSATSFHSTKIFNTGEGGGVVCNDQEIVDRIRRLRFFGYDRDKNIVDAGTNAKMTEIHAALGLANLKIFDFAMSKRKAINDIYKKQFVDNKSIRFQATKSNESNFSYFPVIFDKKKFLLSAKKELEKNNIFPRQYFYPAMTNLKKYNASGKCPISENISERILCLPSYSDLDTNTILFIAQTINNVCDI